MPLLLLAVLTRLVTKKARIWASRAAQSAAAPSSHRPPAFSCCLGTLTQSNTSQPTDSSVSKYYFLEVNCKILPHPQSGLEQSSFSRCWEYYAPGKHKKKKKTKNTPDNLLFSALRHLLSHSPSLLANLLGNTYFLNCNSTQAELHNN